MTPSPSKKSNLYTTRHALRQALAFITRRLPAIRGMGRCILVADKGLTNSNDPASFKATAYVNGPNRFILDLRTWEQKFAFYYGSWEPEFIALTQKLFAGGVFYDIGASIGLYSVTMANICKQQGGHVRAFEPVPQNIHQLEEQIAENNFSHELIQIEKTALSDQPGTAMMTQCETGISGNAKISSSGEVPVEVTTLDAVWAQRNHEPVHFVKIDTEGWDAKIIGGGQEMICACSPNMLIEFNRERMQNNQISLEPAWDFLVHKMAYRVFHLNEQNRLTEIYEPANFENLFFVKEDGVQQITAI